MADLSRGVSNFFGPTPTDDTAYDKHHDGFNHRDEKRFDNSYADSHRARRHRYELCGETSHEAVSVNSREEDCRYDKLHSVARTKEPEQVSIKSESGFQGKYSKTPDIGSHSRDGNIVTFNLSEFDPPEAKRYVDFVARLIFGLRGRTRADGSVFTLYPHDCDINESQFDRVSGQLAGTHGLLVFRISINQLNCLLMSPLLLVLLTLLKLFTYLLLARIMIEMIQSLSRSWQPGRVLSSIGEVTFAIADPPMKLLRRLIPSMLVGNAMVDMSMLVLFSTLTILRMVLWVALGAVAWIIADCLLGVHSVDPGGVVLFWLSRM